MRSSSCEQCTRNVYAAGSLLAEGRARSLPDGTCIGARQTPARGTRPHRRLPRYAQVAAPDHPRSACADALRPATTWACRWYRRAMPVPRRYTTEAIVLSQVRPGRGGPGPDPHHADRRQAQGDRQGRPSTDVAARWQPRAVRRADRRARARPDVRRRDPGERRACLADACATRSRVAATAWYLAELADRSLEERHAAEPLYALLRRAYELLDAGMAPGRVARWYEMHLLDELGHAPRGGPLRRMRPRPGVGRALPLGAAARWRRVRALSRSAARPGRPLARRAQAAQGVPASRHRGDRRPAPRPPTVEREVEAALREFVRDALEREARSLAFLDEVRSEPVARTSASSSARPTAPAG